MTNLVFITNGYSKSKSKLKKEEKGIIVRKNEENGIQWRR